MLAQVHSFVLQGIDPLPYEVEADVAELGLIKTAVVGRKNPICAEPVRVCHDRGQKI